MFNEVINEKIQKKISKIVEDLSQYPAFQDHDVGLKEIKESINEIYKIKNENERQANYNCKNELYVAYLYVLYLSGLSAAIEQEINFGFLPFPSGFREDLQIDPNVIFQNLLIQIVNLALSSINLIQNGFDPSAKIILRSLTELCWITIIVTFDQESMFLYYQSDENKKKNFDIRARYFNAKALKEKLCEIENKLLIDPGVKISSLKKERSSLYRFLSSYTHNSYTSTMRSAYAIPNKKDNETLKSRLFGNFSIESKTTLSLLNGLLCYSSLTLSYIIFKLHRYRFSDDNEFGKDIMVLKECAQNVYLKQ